MGDTVTNNLYSGGIYTGGTQTTSFTISSIANYEGLYSGSEPGVAEECGSFYVGMSRR